MSEYTEQELPMCRARERQLIFEAEREAEISITLRRRRFLEQEAVRVAEYAAYRASVRERLKGAHL